VRSSPSSFLSPASKQLAAAGSKPQPILKLPLLTNCQICPMTNNSSTSAQPRRALLNRALLDGALRGAQPRAARRSTARCSTARCDGA
jgi:hypothetical protein